MGNADTPSMDFNKFKTEHDNFLFEALQLIEYAAYHDGRYNQLEYDKWQKAAQDYIDRVCKWYGRKPYTSLDEPK